MTQVLRGIVVFDLDGTLLRGETVCEMLARPLGRIDQMQEFEQLKCEAEIGGRQKANDGVVRRAYARGVV